MTKGSAGGRQTIDRGPSADLDLKHFLYQTMDFQKSAQIIITFGLPEHGQIQVQIDLQKVNFCCVDDFDLDLEWFLTKI